MTDDGNLLQDKGFQGGQEQQFKFRDNGDGTCCIINRKTGQALYRSGNIYLGQGHPLRLSNAQDCGKGDHIFSIKRLLDKPVYMPDTLGPKNTDHLYTTSLLGFPPAPASFNDLPDSPEKVLIGESLLPFFNVKEDPAFSGSDLMNWQVNNRPYYRIRREQQQQYQSTSYISIAKGASVDRTITYSCGIAETDSSSIEKHTGFAFDYSSTHTASIGITESIKAEASRGFDAQWEGDITITVSETITKSKQLTITEELHIDASQEAVTWIRWLACDIWTIFYDNYKTRTNDDKNQRLWVAPSQIATSSSYPSDVVVTNKVK